MFARMQASGLLALALLACGDDAISDAPFVSDAGGQESTAPAAASSKVAHGFVPGAANDELVFRTDPVRVAPGEEAYTCYGATLTEDTVIDGFSKNGQPFVHNAQFFKAFVPEPEGLSTCNEQFKVT